MLIKAASAIYVLCIAALTVGAIIDPAQYAIPWGGILMLPMFVHATYEEMKG